MGGKITLKNAFMRIKIQLKTLSDLPERDSD